MLATVRGCVRRGKPARQRTSACGTPPVSLRANAGATCPAAPHRALLCIRLLPCASPRRSWGPGEALRAAVMCSRPSVLMQRAYICGRLEIQRMAGRGHPLPACRVRPGRASVSSPLSPASTKGRWLF